MNTHRRDFLRKISSVAALAASGSVLKQDEEAGVIHTSHLTGMYPDQELGGLRDQFPVNIEANWANRTAKAVLLIRILVGWVFLSEGV
jgi:hypothetical protein